MDTPDEASLLERIGDDLVARHLYEAVVHAEYTKDIEQIRTLGRRAGRQRGLNIHTRVSRPDAEGYVVVIVANTTPTHEADELGQRRLHARMRAAVDADTPRSVSLIDRSD